MEPTEEPTTSLEQYDDAISKLEKLRDDLKSSRTKDRGVGLVIAFLVLLGFIAHAQQIQANQDSIELGCARFNKSSQLAVDGFELYTNSLIAVATPEVPLPEAEEKRRQDKIVAFVELTNKTIGPLNDPLDCNKDGEIDGDDYPVEETQEN